MHEKEINEAMLELYINKIKLKGNLDNIINMAAFMLGINTNLTARLTQYQTENTQEIFDNLDGKPSRTNHFFCKNCTELIGHCRNDFNHNNLSQGNNKELHFLKFNKGMIQSWLESCNPTEF